MENIVEGEVPVSSGQFDGNRFETPEEDPLRDLVEEEVILTLKVGDTLGIGSEGFENHLRKMVRGELGSNDFQ